MSSEHLCGRIQQLKHVVDDLPQTVVQREVVVHQVHQEIVVMDVLDDHAGRRLVLIQFGPLLDPQRKGFILRHTHVRMHAQTGE